MGIEKGYLCPIISNTMFETGQNLLYFNVMSKTGRNLSYYRKLRGRGIGGVSYNFFNSTDGQNLKYIDAIVYKLQ